MGNIKCKECEKVFLYKVKDAGTTVKGMTKSSLGLWLGRKILMDKTPNKIPIKIEVQKD